MRSKGQNCTHHNAKEDYSDDRGLINPTEEVSEKH